MDIPSTSGGGGGVTLPEQGGGDQHGGLDGDGDGAVVTVNALAATPLRKLRWRGEYLDYNFSPLTMLQLNTNRYELFCTKQDMIRREYMWIGCSLK